MWFCTSLLFYNDLDWALKMRVGGSIIRDIESKPPEEVGQVVTSIVD